MTRVLLLDDEPLITMLLEDILEQLQYEIVGPAHTVAVALDLIETNPPDAAILDVNIRNEFSYPAADALRIRRIPFMFLTGYGARGIDARYRNEIVRTKPFDFETIREVLSHLLNPGGCGKVLPSSERPPESAWPKNKKRPSKLRRLNTPNLADALESEQFRRFLDQVPIAIVVAEMKARERIVYANPEFERLSGQTATEVEGSCDGSMRFRDAGACAERC
jgi:CheY-like chemotaxis protein